MIVEGKAKDIIPLVLRGDIIIIGDGVVGEVSRIDQYGSEYYVDFVNSSAIFGGGIRGEYCPNKRRTVT